MKSNINRLIAIYSLSMANALVGTGISPALSAISAYFSDAPQVLIQMVVSLPSLLVMVVSTFYSPLTNRVSMRNICVLALGLFTVGGMWGYFVENIYMLIFTRVLVGLAYGLMLPMSTGLVSYFYEKEEQQRLNGNVVVIAALVSILFMVVVGYLASISWRMCFLSYSFGIPCMWYCWKFIPNVTLKSPKNKISFGLVKRVFPFAVGMVSTMIMYFALLNNCSRIVLAEGTVNPAIIGMITSIQTVATTVTAMFADKLKKACGQKLRFVIWGFGVISALALSVPYSLVFLIIGLLSFGVTLGLAVGTFNASAALVCEKEESLSATAVISFSRSLGQFSSPLVMAAAQALTGIQNIRFPYYASGVLAVVMILYFIPVRIPDSN